MDRANVIQPPPPIRYRNWFRNLVILVFLVVMFFVGRYALTARRYMDLRYAVKTGVITEDQLRESLGDEYPDYRKFVDSLTPLPD